ncbi:MAG: hypothetical protein GY938_03045 [Ketobacter sp.]|nr:hypothetical protein [Ketobacter sp.]
MGVVRTEGNRHHFADIVAVEGVALLALFAHVGRVGGNAVRVCLFHALVVHDVFVEVSPGETIVALRAVVEPGRRVQVAV